jgi:hypothetical protein
MDGGATRGTEENQGCAVAALFPRGQPTTGQSDERGSQGHDALPTCDVELDVARRFLRLADIDNGVFERLGRYEAALWRQVRQTLFTLEALRWRTSNSRKWQTQHSWRRSD